MTHFLAAVVRSPIRPLDVEDARSCEGIRARQCQNIALLAARIRAIATVVDEPVRLLVFPVLAAQGGRADAEVKVSDVAAPLPSALLDPLVEVCAKLDCYVATSFVESLARFPGVHFHTGVVIGPTGLLLRSPKAQAFSAPGVTALRDFYDAYCDAYGEPAILPVRSTPLGTLGCMVESEAQAPEAARLLASKGAQIILHPTYDGHPDVPWPAIKQTLAYTNGVYLLSATTARETAPGREEWRTGAATVYGPDGALIASVSGAAEGHAITRIDVDAVTRARARFSRYTEPASVLYQNLYRPSATPGSANMPSADPN